MLYNYIAFTKSGEKVVGTINAANKEEASYELYQKGLIASSVTSTSKKEGGSHVKEDDLIVFTRLLYNAIDAHIPLTRALELTLDETSANSPLKSIGNAILYDIKTGKSISESMSPFPGVFTRLYVSMVRAGEKSGRLSQAFAQILNYLIKRYEMKKKITSALMYPGFIFGFALVVLTFFVTYLIPRFKDSYAGFGSEIPQLTRMLIDFTAFIRNNFLYIIAVLGIIAFVIYRWLQTEDGRIMFEKVLFRTPVIGEIYKKDVVARFTRTVSVLINNGVTLPDALELTRGTVNNRLYEIAIEDAIDKITNGKSFASALKDRPYLPSVLVQMVSMGEESGRLGELLGHLSEFYERDVDASVEKITSVITPILIVFIGIIIGFIVVGLFLPIFDISRMMK